MHVDAAEEPLCARICRANAANQDRGLHFVRACAVEMHLDVSQKPFCARSVRNMPGPTIDRNALGHFTRATSPLCKNLQVKCRRPRPPPTLCASLCNRNALGHFLSDSLCENLQVKCRRPRPRPALCASLRSRNALGHFTRAKLCQNLQKKCRGPDRAPSSSTGLYSYRKNTSVWTCCLGEKPFNHPFL